MQMEIMELVMDVDNLDRVAEANTGEAKGQVYPSNGCLI